MLVGGKKLQKV